MRFDRLRLNGFKSFVDPTDLVIHEGLTGIVGPNGCGKSNLLEALRWVMGENRPTAMRGAGMEDVVFSGTAGRTARSSAEVSLSIDNSERLAPAGLNDDDLLEISRKITRDAGSTYRINGREVRARDVQMLFADASTGAHSPALVRQGQISELISARPKARRRILEEAAGISGLYQRRHEAELKLNSAESNLSRVDDTLNQLGARAAGLARQARTAARYREIGAALRLAEYMALWRRWHEADLLRENAAQLLQAAIADTDSATKLARLAAGHHLVTEAALPPLREEEQIAQAVLARAAAGRQAAEEGRHRALGAIKALTGRLEQIDNDIARESTLNADATLMIARLAKEKAELEAADQQHQTAMAAATAASDAAGESLAQQEAALSRLQTSAAQLAARWDAAEQQVKELSRKQSAAAGAIDAASSRAGTAAGQHEAAAATLTRAGAGLDEARQQASLAEARLATAEATRSAADTLANQTRQLHIKAESEAAALRSEHAALARILERSRASGPSLLDEIRVEAGYEAALGAVLGDDLLLSGAKSGAGWRDLPPVEDAAPLPAPSTALARHVTAPALLTRRLQQTGIVENHATGEALQPALQPGQRLTNKDGDLWRWDGYCLPAGTKSSQTALRLEQMNRLEKLATASTAAEAALQIAGTRHDAAAKALVAATKAEDEARSARRDAEKSLSENSRRKAEAEAAITLALGRAQQAKIDLDRLRQEAEATAHAFDAAEAALAALPDRALLAEEVRLAAKNVEAARIAAVTRRVAADELQRSKEAGQRRLLEIGKDASNWQARLAEADNRSRDMQHRRAKIAHDLDQARAKPDLLASQQKDLARDEAAGKTRLDKARAALSAAETALRDSALAERETERTASAAREARAAADIRFQAAQEAETALRQHIKDESRITPEELREQLQTGLGDADPPELAALEAEIAELRRARDSLGAVNLRADEDKLALEAERDDLQAQKSDLTEAIRKLRAGIGNLNREGRERLLAAFDTVNQNFALLFRHLFGGGEARLSMVEDEDPLDAGLEILCQPPGKRLSTLSLLSGGEQTLTALALIFAVFLANPAPICVLDEVDAPLDDANVARFCDLLDEMTRRTDTRFLIITHHAVTMSRMDRLFGVTMVEQGISQLVSVDLRRAEALVA